MTDIKNPGNPTSLPPQASTVSPDAPPKVASTSLPHTSLDANPVQKQVDAIFQQAGLARAADGSLQVKDSASLGKSSEVAGLGNFEQVYGTGESQLKPPGPPSVELTPATRAGAETFANNIDRALNDFFTKPQVPFAGLAATAELNQAVASSSPAIVQAELKQAAGALVDQALRLQRTRDDANLLKMTAQLRELPQARAYRGVLAQAQPASTTTTGTASATDVTGIAKRPLALRSIAELSPDALLAAFLKLNITDPNNSVDTHNKLHEALSVLRERAIKDAQQKIKVAEELREEAEKDAGQAAYVGQIMSMIRIIVCIIAIVCMFIPGVNLLVLALAVAIITAITMVMQAAAENKAANSQADANQAANDAKRAELMAEQAQQQLQEESEIIKMIIESKNKMVESVIQMMNAIFGARTKLLSVGMAKG
jgi:hypothetical protein